MEILFKNKTKYTKEIYKEFLEFHGEKYGTQYYLYTIAFIVAFIFCIVLQLKTANYLIALITTLILIGFILWRFYHPIKTIQKEVKSKKIEEEQEFTFEFYEKYLKDVLPFQDLWKVEPVFQEKLTYSSISKYKDGSSLKVTSSYLVPILEDGMIIYTGEKEDYGLTVIIEQANGIEVWYSNLKNYRVKLYDYVEKGTLLGEVDNELYIVIKKDGKYLNYEEVF